MNDIISEIKGQIITFVKQALDKQGYDYTDEILVEKPREKAFGDFATNVAMQLARTARKAPRVIAQDILDAMDFSDTLIDHADIAGAGFLNFTLKEEWLQKAMWVIEQRGADYGRLDMGNGEKVMVEYVSANPTGPMHMGNARGGAMGDTLASLLSYAGYDVTREFYLNDAGAQIEKLGKSLEARFLQIVQGDDSVVFPEDGYQGGDIRVHMQNYIDSYGTDMINVDSETRKKAFTEYVLELNIAKLKTDLAFYGVHYDVWFHESSLYQSGEVDRTIALLKDSGYTYEEDGALWLKSSELGCEKDDVLVRNNGIPTYFAVDIAYHKNKFIDREFCRVINIWGADHHGHIARMKAAMQAIGIDPNRLQILTMQHVRLVQDGKAVKMSKRTGEMISLTDLLDDIGVDAARFFFNLRQADSHFDFDMTLATEKTNENPVYYVQYAHARICSMLRLLEQEGITPKTCDRIDLSVLRAPEEKQLCEKLAYFPDEIRNAATSTDPSKMTKYAMDLAGMFHTFYNACRVKGEEDAILYPRLLLVKDTRDVLRSTLDILGVTAPEQM